MAHNPDFKFQPSARHPQLLLKTVPTFSWAPATPQYEPTQAHLATGPQSLDFLSLGRSHGVPSIFVGFTLD